MIRKATTADLNEIVKIYDAIHDLEEKGLTTTGWCRSIYPTIENAKMAIAAGDMFVMEVEGNIVAAARLNQNQEPDYAKINWERKADADKIMVIHTLVVDPQKRRNGYAREFMSFYEEYARKNGCHELRLDTNERNLVARSLYKELGYHEEGVIPTVFNGIEGVNLVMLEKNLISWD